jgi:hypothetical protein
MHQENTRGLRRAVFLPVPSSSNHKGKNEMKNVNSKLMALAGTLAIGATTVYAQMDTMTMRASIPFSFQVGSHYEMQSGDYRISHAANVWSFTNTGTREQVRFLETSGVQDKIGDEAKLVFECRDGNGANCALRAIHVGNGNLGAAWKPPKGKTEGHETARIVVVPVTVTAE